MIEENRLHLWSSFIDRVLANDPPLMRMVPPPVPAVSGDLPRTGSLISKPPSPPPRGVFADSVPPPKKPNTEGSGGFGLAPNKAPKQEELTVRIVKGPRRNAHSGVYPKGYLDKDPGGDRPELFVKLNGPKHLVKDVNVRYARQGEDGETEWQDMMADEEGGMHPLEPELTRNVHEEKTDPQFVLPNMAALPGLLRLIIESDDQTEEPPYKLDIRLG